MTVVDSPSARFARVERRNSSRVFLRDSELDRFRKFNALHVDIHFSSFEVRVEAFRDWERGLSEKQSWLAEHTPSKCYRLYGTYNLEKAYESYLSSKYGVVRSVNRSLKDFDGGLV